MCFFSNEKCWDDSEQIEFGQILKLQSGSAVYIGIYQCLMQNHQQVREALLMAEQVVILSYYDEEAKIYNITKKIEVGGHSHKEIRGLLSAFFIRYKCSRSDILQKTVEYVSRNICQQITLTETAKEIGVTGAYLSTVFKKEIGLNFIEYVNIQKIEAAKIMLDKGKFVYEVSGILGFENVTYFSKVFKKYAGISADKWRKRET